MYGGDRAASVRFAGAFRATLGRYNCRGNHDADKGESDQKVVHLESSVCGSIWFVNTCIIGEFAGNLNPTKLCRLGDECYCVTLR